MSVLDNTLFTNISWISNLYSEQ